MTTNRLTLWLSALAAALVGTLILYDAPQGVNWGIWVALTSAGLIAVRLSTRKPVAKHTFVLLAWATALAFAQTFTTVDVQSPLIVATVAILLGLAVTTLDDSAVGISLPSVAQVPFAALSRVGRRAAAELAAVPQNVRGLKDRPVLRGALIAIPIVLILVALLASADPVMESVRSALLGWTDSWSIDGRVFFFIVLAVITLGAYGLNNTSEPQLSSTTAVASPPFRLSVAETRVILGSVNAVLWLFVVLRVVALTANPGGTAGTGLTYAEYARRGFAELSVAAAIVLGVILFVEVFRKPEEKNSKRTLELTAVVAVEIILASAFRRVLLYEAAYGYTTDRLIAQAYMLVLGAALVLLAWDLSRGAVSTAFGRRGMILTLAAVTIFTYWNYESWIVRENFARARNGSELDLAYLNKLSIAAAPALIDGRNTLNAANRAALDKMLACRKVEQTSHWYEFNVRREKARAALAPFSGGCQQGPLVVTDRRVSE